MSSEQEEHIWKLWRSARERVEPQPRESLEEHIRAHAEAAIEAEEALRLAELQWGREDARLVPVLALVAECVAEVRFGVHDEKPLPYLFRAISLAESSGTSDLQQLGSLYRQTGLALDYAGDIQRAIVLLDQAVKAFERVGRVDEVCFCIGSLATALTKTSPRDALPVCRKYVDLERVRDERSTGYYVALTTLGRCLLLLGDGAEAQTVFSEAKQILLDRAQGRPHPWIAELDAQLAEAQSLIDGKSE